MITTDFFIDNDAVTVANLLIGKTLCRTLAKRQIIRCRIVETEAYFGEDDTACHASKGKTARNSIMYEAGGMAYIYLIYGMYHMLNIVTGPKLFPQAVLIRALEPLDFNQSIAKSQMQTNGPGKLCRYLSIDKTLNGKLLNLNNGLWIEENRDSQKNRVESSRRIGIEYSAESDQQRLWRFFEKDNAYVSINV